MCRLPFVLWSPEYDSKEFDRVFRPDLMGSTTSRVKSEAFPFRRLATATVSLTAMAFSRRNCSMLSLREFFLFYIYKMIFVVEEDKPKNSPHIVGVIGIEKIHRPALAGRRETS